MTSRFVLTRLASVRVIRKRAFEWLEIEQEEVPVGVSGGESEEKPFELV